MDAGTFQGIVTLIALIAFLGMVAYVFTPRRRSRYERLARLPLEEDQKP
jgi:cytochrome c oxidase cbb3-type subunit 4